MATTTESRESTSLECRRTSNLWRNYNGIQFTMTLTDAPTSDKTPFLTFSNDTPVYFDENWSTGIGGGLWSTGLAMALYLQQHNHALTQVQNLYKNKRGKLSLLELGSGNGLLAVCWWAMAGQYLESIIITDVGDHIGMIEETIAQNSHLSSQTSLIVLEHKWGDAALMNELEKPIDIIIGSDVAYREELYDPLIASIVKLSTADTISLIGVTMADTTPVFFDRLKVAGFTYTRLEDYYMDPKFRGNTFGIFIIKKKR